MFKHVLEISEQFIRDPAIILLFSYIFSYLISLSNKV